MLADGAAICNVSAGFSSVEELGRVAMSRNDPSTVPSVIGESIFAAATASAAFTVSNRSSSAALGIFGTSGTTFPFATVAPALCAGEIAFASRGDEVGPLNEPARDLDRCRETARELTWEYADGGAVSVPPLRSVLRPRGRRSDAFDARIERVRAAETREAALLARRRRGI